MALTWLADTGLGTTLQHHLHPISELVDVPATTTRLLDPLVKRPRPRFPSRWRSIKVRVRVWKPLLSTRLSKKAGRVLRMSPARAAWCGLVSRPPP